MIADLRLDGQSTARIQKLQAQRIAGNCLFAPGKIACNACYACVQGLPHKRKTADRGKRKELFRVMEKPFRLGS